MNFSGIATKAVSALCVITAIAGCSGEKPQPIANAWEYEHTLRYAKIYADSILNLDTESMEMQSLLLDINHRASRLSESHGKALGAFFRYSVDDIVRTANPERGAEILGSYISHPWR